MTKLKLRTYWYDQWDKGQPQPSPTTCTQERKQIRRHRYLITYAICRRPHITPAHPPTPDLTIQFSRN
jgi:hypothetical protein